MVSTIEGFTEDYEIIFGPPGTSMNLYADRSDGEQGRINTGMTGYVIIDRQFGYLHIRSPHLTMSSRLLQNVNEFYASPQANGSVVIGTVIQNGETSDRVDLGVTRDVQRAQAWVSYANNTLPKKKPNPSPPAKE